MDRTRSRTTTRSAAVASDGRLGRLLAATGERPEVGWVADPALLAAAAVAADPAVNAWGTR